jgi:hypothetical protein
MDIFDQVDQFTSRFVYFIILPFFNKSKLFFISMYTEGNSGKIIKGKVLPDKNDNNNVK